MNAPICYCCKTETHPSDAHFEPDLGAFVCTDCLELLCDAEAVLSDFGISGCDRNHKETAK